MISFGLNCDRAVYKQVIDSAKRRQSLQKPLTEYFCHLHRALHGANGSLLLIDIVGIVMVTAFAPNDFFFDRLL